MSPAVVDGLSVNLRVQIRSFKPTCIFPFSKREGIRVFIAVGAQGIHITIDVVANKLRSTAGKGYKKTCRFATAGDWIIYCRWRRLRRDGGDSRS